MTTREIAQTLTELDAWLRASRAIIAGHGFREEREKAQRLAEIDRYLACVRTCREKCEKTLQAKAGTREPGAASQEPK